MNLRVSGSAVVTNVFVVFAPGTNVIAWLAPTKEQMGSATPGRAPGLVGWVSCATASAAKLIHRVSRANRQLMGSSNLHRSGTDGCACAARAPLCLGSPLCDLYPREPARGSWKENAT